jgi:hypothetical protein
MGQCNSNPILHNIEKNNIPTPIFSADYLRSLKPQQDEQNRIAAEKQQVIDLQEAEENRKKEIKDIIEIIKYRSLEKARTSSLGTYIFDFADPECDYPDLKLAQTCQYRPIASKFKYCIGNQNDIYYTSTEYARFIVENIDEIIQKLKIIFQSCTIEKIITDLSDMQRLTLLFNNKVEYTAANTTYKIKISWQTFGKN